MAFLCQYILNINCLWKILSKIVLFNAYLGFLLSQTVSIPIISSRTKFATLTPCLEVSRQAARTTPWRRGWRRFWGWSTIGRKRSRAKPHSMFHVGHRHTGQHHLVHPGHGVVAEWKNKSSMADLLLIQIYKTTEHILKYITEFKFVRCVRHVTVKL